MKVSLSVPQKNRQTFSPYIVSKVDGTAFHQVVFAYIEQGIKNFFIIEDFCPGDHIKRTNLGRMKPVKQQMLCTLTAVCRRTYLLKIKYHLFIVGQERIKTGSRCCNA